jgi:hypothetical protein
LSTFLITQVLKYTIPHYTPSHQNPHGVKASVVETQQSLC